MYYVCCMCKSSRQDAILYRFPSTEKRFILWLKCLNRDDLKLLSPRQLSKLFVCQKHFEKKFVTPKSRLLGRAYPTLFTADEISSGIPSLVSTDTTTTAKNEHNYVKKRIHEDHTYYQTEISQKMEHTTEIGMRDIVEVTPCNLHTFDESESNFQEDQPLSPNSPGCEDACTTYIAREMGMSMDITPSNLHNFEETESNLHVNQPWSNLPVHENARTTSIARDITVPVPSKPKEPLQKRRIMFKKTPLLTDYSELYQQYVKTRKQLEYSKRAIKASKFNKVKAFEKLTKRMNPIAKKFLWMQIRQCTKKVKGRRFTEEEKLLALLINKQSPECYRFMRKIFILPSKITLEKMVSSINIPGIDIQLVPGAVKQEDDAFEENENVYDEALLESAVKSLTSEVS